MNATSRAGLEVASIREAFETARVEETVSGLLAAEHLRRLRATAAHTLLAKTSLAALLGAEVPALDAASARALARVLEAFRPEIIAGSLALAALAPFGLTRLLLIAESPTERRAEMLAVGPLPLAELRRWKREAQGAEEAAALRRHLANIPLPARRRVARAAEVLSDVAVSGLLAGSAADRLDAARASLAAVRRYWRDTGAALFLQGRLLASLEPVEPMVERAVRDSLAVDHGEWERLAGPARAWPELSSERAGELGLPTLRELAALPETTPQRAEIAERLLAGGLSADAALALIREIGRPAPVPDSPPRTPKTPVTAVVRDDPDDLASLNLFHAARGPAPHFADALPPALLEQLIRRTTRPDGHLWDPMAGAGASLAAAARLGRSAEGSDLLDPALSAELGVADARHARPTKAPDLVLLHPPVPMEVVYSERYAGRRLGADLSGMDPESYRRALGALITNVAGVLRPTSTLALVIREGRWQGQFCDWPREAAAFANAAGLTIVERMYVPLPLEERAEILARRGFLARSRGELLAVVWTVLLCRRGAR